MRRIFIDAEFKNLPWSGHSEMLWVGLADDEGNCWSGINADVAVDVHASDFTRRVVMLRMPEDEPRLNRTELDAAIRDFCGSPDEFWAWCPSVETLAIAFDLGEHAPAARELYWGWDLQLLRRVVDPWPASWPTQLHDLNEAARAAGIRLPPNNSGHHPRFDALWNRSVFRLLQAAQR